MTSELTLLTKAYDPNQIKQVEKLVNKIFEGLDVKTKVSAEINQRWIHLALSGEDEIVARNLISNEIGLCPMNLQTVKRLSVLKGYFEKPDGSHDEVHTDIGVFHPTTVFANISLANMQAVLVDGRKLALKKIVELFGFCEGLPISVKINEINMPEKRIEAEFAFEQLEKFSTWQESLLDRLIVLGSSINEIKKMLKFTGLERDIIDIESLGLFEFALTCKLGTDAAGLVRIVGRNLKNAKFSIFNPRRIRDFLRQSFEMKKQVQK